MVAEWKPESKHADSTQSSAHCHIVEWTDMVCEVRRDRPSKDRGGAALYQHCKDLSPLHGVIYLTMEMRYSASVEEKPCSSVMLGR
jgi:hypothetical protein